VTRGDTTTSQGKLEVKGRQTPKGLVYGVQEAEEEEEEG